MFLTIHWECCSHFLCQCIYYFGHNQSNSYFCVPIMWLLWLRSKGKRRWHCPRGGVQRTKIKKLIKSTTYQSPGGREQEGTFPHSSKIRKHLLSPWFKIFGRNKQNNVCFSLIQVFFFFSHICLFLKHLREFLRILQNCLLENFSLILPYKQIC